ncbi:hypothetical protein Tco_0897669, partial [Tanacetum coccineum]
MSGEFNADDYDVLVAHLAPFRKFPEPFLYLIGMSRYYTLDKDTYPSFLHDDGTEMDLSAFIHVVDPTKVKVGRVVPLLLVAPTRSESKLEASVDKLFDEGDSADQGDFAADGGHDAEIELVTRVKIISAEVVIAERPRRWCRGCGDHAFSYLFGVYHAGREGSNPTDSIVGLNLRTIGPSERSAVLPPMMTEAVVTSHAASDPPISVPEMGTKITSLVHASMFHDSDSTEINVLSDSLLDDSDVSWEFIDHLAPLALFSQIREMDNHHLFTEFNVGTAHQACLNAEVRMRPEYCLSERSRLESECKKQAYLLKARDDEIENLKAQLLLKEAEATEAVRLRSQVFVAEATEKMHADEIDALKQRNVALENEKDCRILVILMIKPRTRTVKTDMVKHDVEVESSGECVDKIDKLTK